MNNMQLDRQDSIDSYVRGEMTAQERLLFERQMAADTTLADEVALLRRAVACVADIATKRRMIAQWDSERATAEAGHHGWARRVVAMVVTAAACVAVACLLVTGNGTTAVSPLDGLDLGLTAPAARGGLPSDDVAAMVLNEDYQGASALIAAESEELEQERALTAAADNMATEEQQYTLELIDDELYRLQWLNIIALVGSQHHDEAVVLLDRFVTIDGCHRRQAETLLQRLTE